MIIENLFVENFQKLNDTDLHIWDYVSKNPLEVEDMTIDQLAEKCNVSRTTVLRFAKKLGLKGFKDFKSYLKLDNSNRENGNIINQFTNMYIDVTKLFTTRDMTDLFNKIYESKNIYVFANSYASSIKKELIKKFLPYNKFIIDLADYLETNVLVDSLDERDLFIIISTNSLSDEMIKLMKKLRERKVPTLTISNKNLSKIGLDSEYNLFVPAFDLMLKDDIHFISIGSYFLIVELMALRYGLYLEEKND